MWNNLLYIFFWGGGVTLYTHAGALKLGIWGIFHGYNSLSRVFVVMQSTQILLKYTLIGIIKHFIAIGIRF